MSTGYTCVVEDGTVTELKPFVFRCARAFGALVHLRDSGLTNDIPDSVPEESDYHERSLEKAKDDLQEFKAMTPDKAQKIIDSNFETETIEYHNSIDRMNTIRLRYESMIDKVKSWEPPSPDHFELKKFMLDQLNESVKWSSYRPNYPVKQDPDKWLKAKIKKCHYDINYHEAEILKQNRRIYERNLWIKLLKESLEK